MINEKTFVAVINNMRDQYDKDNERAKALSEIYGSDIDPVDNKLLTESIWIMLMETFNDDQIETIQHFCYEQDFGRKLELKVETLYEQLIKQIDVTDAREVGPSPSIH